LIANSDAMGAIAARWGIETRGFSSSAREEHRLTHRYPEQLAQRRVVLRYRERQNPEGTVAS
jgi:hypothetical protein